MKYQNIKLVMGSALISFSLMACSNGSGGSSSVEQGSQGVTPQNSASVAGASKQKAPLQQGTSSSSSTVILNGSVVNSNGSQNIASNGGGCAPMTAGGTQVSVISGSNISNVNMKAASSSLYECEQLDSGEKFSVSGQVACMSKEACIGKLSQLEAVRAVESPCRDAVVLSDSEVESLLVK